MRKIVIEDIISEHAEEASFLWTLRNQVLWRPRYSLNNLVELDDRLDAHLDGLKIAGELGWKIAKSNLMNDEAGEVFVPSLLAWESGDPERINQITSVGCTSPNYIREIVSSLGWIGYTKAQPHIERLLQSEVPTLNQIGLAASAILRHDLGEKLGIALDAESLLVRARALKAIGELGRKDLLHRALEFLSDADDRCRFSAAWSSVLLGNKLSIATLRGFTKSPEWGERGVILGIRALDLNSAHIWQREIAHQPGMLRLSVMAAGHLGDPVLIPWLIEEMLVPERARVAGEAFTMITGADITQEDLKRDGPDGFESDLTESPEDENITFDDDEDLTWPNPELVQRWWQKNKGRFRQGIRYFLGQQISTEFLVVVLKTGLQRQRVAAALELALRRPGSQLFETRAPGFRQKQILDGSFYATE